MIGPDTKVTVDRAYSAIRARSGSVLVVVEGPDEVRLIKRESIRAINEMLKPGIESKIAGVFNCLISRSEFVEAVEAVLIERSAA